MPLAKMTPIKKDRQACRTDKEESDGFSQLTPTVVFSLRIRLASLTISIHEGGFSVFMSFMTKKASSNTALSVFFK